MSKKYIRKMKRGNIEQFSDEKIKYAKFEMIIGKFLEWISIKSPKKAYKRFFDYMLDISLNRDSIEVEVFDDKLYLMKIGKTFNETQIKMTKEEIKRGEKVK